MGTTVIDELLTSQGDVDISNCLIHLPSHKQVLPDFLRHACGVSGNLAPLKSPPPGHIS